MGVMPKTHPTKRGAPPSACGTYHSLRSGTMSPKWARDVAVGMGSWAADLGEEVGWACGDRCVLGSLVVCLRDDISAADMDVGNYI